MDKIFNKPFAINGARVNIPENGTENERVSFDKGFTQPYEVEAPSIDNPNGQGFNILRPEMNEALYQLSNACNFLAENIDKWTLLTTENLNDITQNGRYYQSYNSQATNNRNYPEPYAGYLIVVNQGIDGSSATQIYKSYNNDNVYLRKRIGDSNWSAWDRLILESEFNRKIEPLENIIIGGGASSTGHTPDYIQPPSIYLPIKNGYDGVCILVSAFYNVGNNTPIDTYFIFKIDGVEVGSCRLWKNGQTGEGIGTYNMVSQVYIPVWQERKGKRITAEINQVRGAMPALFNFLAVWQSEW